MQHNCECLQRSTSIDNQIVQEAYRMPLENLGVPGNRRQVELLELWLKDRSNSIDADRTMGINEKEEKLQTTYQFALLELNRQVSLECVERGHLLQTLIDQYTGLIKK